MPPAGMLLVTVSRGALAKESTSSHSAMPCSADSGELHGDCCAATSLPTAQPSTAAHQVRHGRLWVLWVLLECLSLL